MKYITSKITIILSVLFVLTFGTSVTLAAAPQFTSGRIYTLYGGGISSTDTTIKLTSFRFPVTNYPITTSDLVGAPGDYFYPTIDESTNKKEIVKCTGVNQNSDGTAALTGCTRGLEFSYPYTSSSTLKLSHSGGSNLVLSNPPQLYQSIIQYINEAVQTGAGVNDASFIAKGIVEIATGAEAAATTPVGGGSTSAYLALTSSISTSTWNTASLAANKVLVSNGSGKIDSNFVSTSTLGMLLAGMRMSYATTTPPAGWLIEDGSAVSRSTYSSLYNVVGNTYGAGDGVTTFTLPASVPTRTAQLKSLKLTASQYAQNTSTSGLTSSSGDGAVALWFNLASSSGTMNEKFLFNNRAANMLVSVGPSFTAIYVNGGSQKQVPVNTAFASSTWYHLAWSYNSSTGVATAYVNGSSTGSIATGGTALANTASTLYIGANQGTGDFFPGNIANVKFYNRQLTPQDVIGSMGYATTTGVTGAWRLDGSPSDLSGTGNNLTLVNSPSYATTTMPDIGSAGIIKY